VAVSLSFQQHSGSSPTVTQSTQAKLKPLLQHLNHGLIERESAVNMAVLALLARENLLLVGPPGTAKSLVARKVARALGDTTPFEYLLTKFTTPEELFGPLSLSELKADRFRRNTAGFLPTAQVAFLDEIFKASSSILNTLLILLNERLFHNGAQVEAAPLQTLIAASNEIPSGQEELQALYDRFVLRLFVDYVKPEHFAELLQEPGPEPQIEPLTLAEIEAVRAAARRVTLPEEIVSALHTLRVKHQHAFKEDKRESLSDRRLKKVVWLMRVSAAANGRTAVDLSDMLLLKNCLWNHPDNADKVFELVREVLHGLSRPVPKNADAPAPAKRSKPTGQRGSLVKGYKGSGTEDDPLLIETLHDLVGLERPEVGQQGYHFRQTADIDCSEITSWPQITFRGHYDGGGYCISSWINARYLFEAVQAQSRIANLELEGLGLAETIEGSEIFYCQSNRHLHIFDALIEKAESCQITGCQASNHLILDEADNCVISQCRSGHALINRIATQSNISDCEVHVNERFDKEWNTYINVGGFGGRLVAAGGIARSLEETAVSNCFVTANLTSNENPRVAFCGITPKGDCSSTVQQCAIGRINLENGHKLHHRVSSKGDWQPTLSNNIALDVTPGTSDSNGLNALSAIIAHMGVTSDPNGPDGKSVSPALFTQRYFEEHLGWDFDNVWQWNAERNEPELRRVGVGAAPAKAAAVEMSDSLSQQLAANLFS
jgi:MoxR-like ATPase